MDLQQIVVGLLALLVGLAFTFVGYQLFLILLPVWGFFAGFFFGAEVVSIVFGTGFLADVTGFVVGLIFGVLFAIASYLWYWLAVTVLGASVGYAVGIGVAGFLGITGNFNVVIGILVAIGFALLAIWLRLPKYLAILLTGIGGAFSAVGGVAVLLGKIPTSAIASGSFGVVTDLSWIWLAAAVILAVIGIAYQTYATSAYEQIGYHRYRNPGMAVDATSPGAPV